ncbi:hypothetical protein BJX99DRAFT_265713 [Aspergillus californicus]
MQSVAWSHVNQTNPSPYDQVFILSESVIERSFENLFSDDVPVNRPPLLLCRTSISQSTGLIQHVELPPWAWLVDDDDKKEYPEKKPEAKPKEEELAEEDNYELGPLDG